jgi:DNA-binding transcriptional LysR family regulator
LRRAQSVVSQTLANLEAQLDVKLFDRSSRQPVLTSQGLALLAEARAVVSGMDVFKARAKGLAQGLEPELSVVVDVMELARTSRAKLRNPLLSSSFRPPAS